jgi:hypothetical protein
MPANERAYKTAKSSARRKNATVQAKATEEIKPYSETNDTEDRIQEKMDKRSRVTSAGVFRRNPGAIISGNKI